MTASGDLADARTALHAQWDRLRSWVTTVVDDDVADQPSVLEGWTVSELVAHLGRDRGGVTAALGSITARALVIAVDSDRLFPPAQSERIAAGIPGAEPLRTIHSDYGHDGFLIEEDLVGASVHEFLEQGARR